MSRRAEKNAATTEEKWDEATEATAEKTDVSVRRAAKADKTGPRVYCGPTVRGVAKQYTVYSGDIPEALKEFIAKHPAAKALLVPVERFAQTRKKMETAGTAEAILYHQIKSEL